MKKIHFLLITAICLLLQHAARASHCAGGELLYQWVSDSTYRVTFKLYRDCAGNTAPASVDVCCVNTCNNTNQSTTLTRLATLPDGRPNGATVNSGCGGYPSKCESSASTLPGYAEWWYDGLVTLDGRCSEWQFSVSISARNASANLTGGSNNLFYVATTLNNLVAQGNSSPIFSVKPVPYVCINNPYTYNNGALDPDGDSLGYEILQPQAGNCGSGGSPISFTGANLYNTTNNPIPTGNSFRLDPITGQLSFTPTQTGANTLTLRVKEYRRGVVIGSAMRDIQVQILVCNSVQPNFIPDTLNVTGGSRVNGRFENCAGTPMQFCFKVKSPNAGAVLVASDNHLAVTPGSVINYTGQKTDSITGCFVWTPGPADTGLRNLAITVKDSTCAAPGIAVSQTFVLPIYIFSVTKISKDSTICAGSSVPLQATGGTVFTWSVLPGGAPLSSLSCTSCSNPVATPAITTRYVVSSNLQSVCNKARDTVLITVNQLPAAPQIITNSPVCVGDSLRFTTTANTTSYIWSGPAGFRSGLRSPVIANAQLPNGGSYQLTVKNGTCASPQSTVTVTVARTPTVPVISGRDTLCEGEAIDLDAATSGTYFKWTGPNGFTAGSRHLVRANATAAQSGRYILTAYNSSTLACPSQPDTLDVLVSPKLQVTLDISRHILCAHDTITVTSSGLNTAGARYSWSFREGDVVAGTGAGPYIIRYPAVGIKTISVSARNGGCADSGSDAVHILAAPSSDFELPAHGCLDDTIRVMGAPAVGYDVALTWDFGSARVGSGAGPGPYYLTYNTPGTKTVTLLTRSEYCPSPLTTKTIDIHPRPEARIISTSSSTGICAGDPVHFVAASSAYHAYQWQPSRFFTAGGAEADGRIGSTGYVVLRVTDTLGCSAQDSILIATKPCCQVTMPNAFTPNNDGHNDLFRMVTAGHPLTTAFRVFNRWGQEIFSTGDAAKGWDGTANNKPVDGGTYYYYIRYQCADEQYYELKGEVLLIR